MLPLVASHSRPSRDSIVSAAKSFTNRACFPFAGAAFQKGITAEHNVINGFGVNGSADALLQNSSASENEGSGFRVAEQATATLIGNTATANQQQGFIFCVTDSKLSRVFNGLKYFF